MNIQTSFLPDDEQQETPIDQAFVDSSRLGRYAEFMVCAELTRLGYHVIHVDAPGFDIIMAVDGVSLRVQVKSTNTIVAPLVRKPGGGRPPNGSHMCRWGTMTHDSSSNGGRNANRKVRPLCKTDADLLALYHHQFGTTVILPLDALNKSGYVALPVSQVKDHDTKSSLAHALEKLGVSTIDGGTV